MRATINKSYALNLDDNIRVTQMDKNFTIFRATKGLCDRELFEAAADGTIYQLSDSLGEWQIMVRTETIKWEE